MGVKTGSSPGTGQPGAERPGFPGSPGFLPSPPPPFTLPLPTLPAGSIATAAQLNELAAAANFLLNKPIARVHDGAGSQSIAVTPSNTVIKFANRDIDNVAPGMWSSSATDRLTIQTAGWHKVRYGVSTNATKSVNTYVQQVCGSNNPLGAGSTVGPYWPGYTVQGYAGASGVWPAYLYAGDYLQVHAFADSGGALTEAAISPSFFSLEWVHI